MRKNLIENLLAFVFFGFFLFLGYGALNVSEDSQKIPNDALEVIFLDVGQGDSILINAPSGENILIDGGPDKAIIGELDKNLPLFDREIEAMILTHPHADHLAGLNYVLDRYQVDKIYLSGVSHNTPDFITFLEKINQKKIPVEQLYFGKFFSFQGLTFKILWPDKDKLGGYEMNDTSIIVDLAYRDNAFLFLGDLSADIQDKIISRFRAHYDVVKISHHGSKTGASSILMQKIKPEYAVITVGKKNYFGHPSPVTLRKLAGINILRTDLLGTIGIYGDGQGVFLR